MLKNITCIGCQNKTYHINDYLEIATPRVSLYDLKYNGISRIISIQNREKIKELHKTKDIIAVSLSNTKLAFSYIPQAISMCKRQNARLSLKNHAGIVTPSSCNLYKYCPICNTVFAISHYERLWKLAMEKFGLITITGMSFNPDEYAPDHRFRHGRYKLQPTHILKKLYTHIFKLFGKTNIISMKPSPLGSGKSGYFVDFFILIFNITPDVTGVLTKLKDILSFSKQDFTISFYESEETGIEQVFDIFSFLTYRVQPELKLNYGIKLHPLIFSHPGVYFRGIESPFPGMNDKRKVVKFLDVMLEQSYKGE